MSRPAQAATSCVMLLCAGYFGLYLHYRLLDDGAVLNYSGPFTCAIGESFATESLVSRLATWTGIKVAPTVNIILRPLMQLDARLTGHHIRFTDQIAKPIWSSGSQRYEGMVVDDPSLEDSEDIDNFSFIHYLRDQLP